MSIGIILLVVLGVVGAIILGVFLAKNAKGKMTLTLSKGGYQSGEPVQGTVDLLVKKELDAQRIFVSLIGYAVEERRDHDGDRRTEQHEIFRDETDLEPGRVLPAGTHESYSFELIAPSGDHMPKTGGGGFLDGVDLNIGGISLGGNRRTRLKWKVESRVDVKGLDVTASRSVQINLA